MDYSEEITDFITWDSTLWVNKFNSRNDDADHYRSLRRDVYQNTVNIINQAGYISANGKVVELDLNCMQTSAEQTVFYPDSRKIQTSDVEKTTTETFAIESDCLEMTRLLQIQNYKPAVLNMASNTTPGGGVIHGSGAQEENLFRRTTALKSYYQFSDYAEEYGTKRNPFFSYPIPFESGGIYSPDIMVFKSSEKTGYYLLDNPYPVDIVSVAAISNPRLIEINGQLYISDEFIEPTKEKIRAIFRIALNHKHDALVLSAFGCGAFANPPEHMADLFQSVLAEPLFNNSFKLVVFAIIDDHNTRKRHNPNGNIIPFQQVFNR